MPIVATDPFVNWQTGLDSVWRHSFAIVPSDTDDVSTNGSRGVYVGVGGDVTYDTFYETAILLKAVPQGFVIPALVKRVRSTGTTATTMVGGY